MTQPNPGPWTGRVLHVDLSTGRTELIPTSPMAESYLGGRGLAARLAWDLIPPGIGALDPRNPLMFMVGALVGTPAPSSGRVTVSGLSPQAYPDEWYTRANLGGHWGSELKYAGYDGLVVTGRAPKPVYLWIEDDRVELRDAASVWGQGLIQTQKTLQGELGPDVRVVAIGPAGENLCRYAVLATSTESAAGQGGFGAVMGSKNLKAVAVRGHGGVGVAQPAEALRRSRLVMQAILKHYGRGKFPEQDMPADERRAPCTYMCPRSCGNFYRQMPGVLQPERTYSGQVFCCAPLFGGGAWLTTTRFSHEIAVELAQVANDLGINHWEPLFGLVPWIRRCQKRGELLELGGEKLDFDNPQTWLTLLQNVAYRRSWGDLLAEGGPRVARTLGVGEDLIEQNYPAWGQASHWDGHGTFTSPYFPYWLVTALQWAMDTRDPMGGGHGYTTNIFGLTRAVKPGDDESLRKLLNVGEQIYGCSDAVDPRGGYRCKAGPAVFHHDRAAIKDSLGICDNIFPFLTSRQEDDWLIRVDGVDGAYLEHYLFQAATGWDISREDFYAMGTRIFTAERMLAHHNWGRSRGTDETIMAYLSYPEGTTNPWLSEPVTVDGARFRALLDEYYDLRGWDRISARPSDQALESLGMMEFIPVLDG
jgi:aldehyde:ferredoxin oxidoreductase